jgi:uncharacterized membrane protein YphA (DoxX/SURF4 family)
MELAQLAEAEVLVLTTRLTLGLLLLTSALGKLRDLPGFTAGVADYRLLPTWAVRPVALALPALELVLALALLGGLALPLAGAGTALLVAGFSGAVALNLRRGRRIACHCHGLAGSRPIGWGLVARNGLLLGLALVVALVPSAAAWPALNGFDGLVVALLVGWLLLVLALVEWVVEVQVRTEHVKLKRFAHRWH